LFSWHRGKVAAAAAACSGKFSTTAAACDNYVIEPKGVIAI
jgi:hypothetical protein